MTTTDGQSDIVLINDLDSLREAVNTFNEVNASGALRGSWEDMEALFAAIEITTDLVPRLIKSYEDVLDASFELTRLVELMNQNRSPEGLYLP
jgi:hypothetical protein